MIKTALLFAGQGAQVVGMGQSLQTHSPRARALFEQANAALGYDLSRICFSGPDAELTRTENAQPGIYLVSWVALELLREHCSGLSFEATAGLSLGEFTALAAAGALSFEDGLRLVRLRGRFMQEACDQTHGTMAAVLGLEDEPLAEVCRETGVELANLNCPGQRVISGENSLIERACELAKARGAKRALPLPVAGAYHSRLMASAQPKLQTELDQIPIRPPQVPVIANVTAQPHGDPAQVRRLLVQQVTAPVLWEQSMRALMAQGFNRFIELGPGTALTGFLKRIDRHVQALQVADAASLQETARVLQADPRPSAEAPAPVPPQPPSLAPGTPSGSAWSSPNPEGVQ
jgi:[acyl-carrier-protein] S-malonyltransferase